MNKGTMLKEQILLDQYVNHSTNPINQLLFLKSPSIWDQFSHSKLSENGDIADDSYDKFEEDLACMEKIGVTTYRFSLAWSRLLRFDTIGYQLTGIPEVNQDGVNYYTKIMQKLQEKNIRIAVTLYHWDLPLALNENNRITN